MKRKLLALAMAMIFAAAGVGASDFRFFVDGIDQHPTILIGFLPTYVSGGVGYSGIELLEGDTTEFTLRAGAGYIERRFWNSPKDGLEYREMDPLTFDAAVVDWGLEFSQGFLDSPVGGKDFITLSVGYEGKYEKSLDSRIAGREDKQSWGMDRPVQTMESFLGTGEWEKYYPDLAGNHQYLGTNLYFNFFLDGMEDTLSTNDGYAIEFNADWAPMLLNSALDGYADFYQLTLECVAAKTLYQYATADDMNWFSLVVIDRLRANWLSGDAVPTYARKLGSLGRQVRGYSNYTYGMEFQIVNNFDIRLTGPDMGVDGLAVRINLFFDMGYACGRYFNTDEIGGQFLSSTGAQFTLSIFDFIDLGYQLAYLIGDGRNFAKGDTPLVGSFTFFLDF